LVRVSCHATYAYVAVFLVRSSSVTHFLSGFHLLPSFSSLFDWVAGSSPSTSLMYEYQQVLAMDAQAPSGARTLRSNWVPRGDEVCLNILFVAAELDGVMGIARQGEVGSSLLGGICESRTQGGKLYNVAIVNAPVFDTSAASASSPYVARSLFLSLPTLIEAKCRR